MPAPRIVAVSSATSLPGVPPQFHPPQDRRTDAWTPTASVLGWRRCPGPGLRSGAGARPRRRLSAPARAELAEDVVDVALDGRHADVEPCRDLLVRQAVV